jgi:hypothetical protein
MGITITADESMVPPRPTALVLTCDGDHGDLFGTITGTFMHADGFAAEHALAMRAGWKERDGKGRGRPWLCPLCSGK